MCRLCFWINLFHPGIVEVCVHPFFYLVLCFDSLCPLIVAHQRRGRNDHITAHKYSQNPGNDLAWSHRYFLDQARKKGIYFFEPYNCCDSPEKAIQKIDPSSKIKWQFTVIPKYFSEKNLCKYTAQIFISTAKKSTCQKKETLTGVLNINNMIPVPDNCLTQLKYNQIENFRSFSNEKEKTDYIYLLQKEKFLIDNVQDILQNKALKLYQKCISKPGSSLAARCCDFKMLEEKCRSYPKK